MSQTKAELIKGLNINASAPATALQIDASGNVNIDSNTLYVDATNNRVGLGTSAPKEVIDSRGALVISGDNATSTNAFGTAEGVLLSTGTGVGRITAISNGNNNVDLSLRALNAGTATEGIRIKNDGKVGIGTTSPGARLTIVDGVDTTFTGLPTNIGLVNTGALAAGLGAGINFGATFATGITTTYAVIAGCKENATSSNAAGYLAFGTRDSGAGTSIERARIDSSGRLLVGTSSSVPVLSSATGAAVQVNSSAFGSYAQTWFYGANNEFAPVIMLAKSRNTTYGSYTVVQNNDQLGGLWFAGDDGTDLNQSGAKIEAFVDGTPGNNDMPGRLVFSTTADGASIPTERMTLYSSGYIKIGNTSSAYVYPGIDNSLYLGSPSFRWNLVYSVNGTASSSDEREKTEISDSSLGIDFVKSLRPVSYKWKIGHNDVETNDEGDVTVPRPGLRTHWGFLAQEVKQSADDAGVDFGGWILTDTDDPESSQGLRYQQFIAPLTKALQEAIAKIETLEAKVAALEAS